MHNFKLGDKVYHKADAARFEVVGIRKETVEILTKKGFKNIVLKKDFVGNDRMIKANL